MSLIDLFAQGERTTKDHLAGLNPEQRDATTTISGPMLILAGAGSGKTRVITQRIAHLIDSCDVRPESILAVTFTNKAAGELKLRLRAGLDRRLRETSGESAVNLQAALAHLEEASIGTIHAFCAQVLRERPVEACVDPAFEELNELQSGELRNRAFHAWFQKRLNEDSPALRRALMRVWSIRAVARDRSATDRWLYDRRC